MPVARAAKAAKTPALSESARSPKAKKSSKKKAPARVKPKA
jgi:hypothetical protein